MQRLIVFLFGLLFLVFGTVELVVFLWFFGEGTRWDALIIGVMCFSMTYLFAKQFEDDNGNDDY